MSTPSSGSTRRRRIAGERRGPGASTATTSAPVTDPSPPEAPAEAGPPEPSGPAADPAPRPRRRLGLPRRERRAGSRGGRRGPTGLVVGLAALLVLLLAYSGLLLMGWLGNDGLQDISRADDEAAAARTAQASAERAADAVLAYDYRSLDSDRDAATRFMTERYAEQYRATFDTAVKEAAADAKAQVAVEVQAAAVITADTDEARILLFVDQTTLSSSSDQPRQALNRAEFQMVRQGDTWLVDDILSF